MRTKTFASIAWTLSTLATNGCGTSPDGNTPPGWRPLDRSHFASCGAPLSPTAPPPRTSSLRRGSCDFGETVDFATQDFLCAPGTSCTAPQTGDQLCHRICDDGQCAASETCAKRPIYESDTPTRYANLCMCAAGACSENTATDSVSEGGLDAWRDEAAMPIDLYYHAAVATDRYLFVSGGLHVTERSSNGSATLQPLDTVYVAALDASGAVSNWQKAGALPAPTVNHAMTVVGDRLYVAGGHAYPAAGSVAPAAPTFADTVVSYAIRDDGSLDDQRSETPLPHARGWHVLLSEPGDATSGRAARIVVASGATDASFFTDGTKEIDLAEVGSEDGKVGAWSVAETPAALYYDGAAGVAAGSFFGFASGEYTDRSSRALYGIALRDLTAGVAQTAFTMNVPWSSDPAALSAVNKHVRLGGSCEALVLVGEKGATATAPVDGAAHTGPFRAAARSFGETSGAAIATAPSERIYVTGGASPEAGNRVRSVRHL